MVSQSSADIVICGAGIAGVAAAWALAERGAQVLLVDERPPLSLTSDKSSECYRNFWPGPGDAMVGLMNRSIDVMERLAEASGNAIGMNRRGYVYATCDPARIPLLRAAAEEACTLGAGPLRVHADGVDHAGAAAGKGEQPYQPAQAHGYAGEPDGADLLLDQALIRRHFPYLADQVVAVLHARRAGWLSAQQLGAYLLERAREAGARVVSARIGGVERDDGKVAGVRLADGTRLRTTCFVNAAGPMLRPVGALLGIDLPVFSERHHKLAFEDRLGAIPREAPMVIGADPLVLPWSDEERELLAETDDTRHLLETLPAGAHFRPEGHGASRWVLALWAYHATPAEELFPLPPDEQFAELVLRRLSQLVPALAPYTERPPRPVLDGGYYTRTPENRPLIGPLAAPGAYVLGALSGYGIMAACGAAELLTAHIAGGPLPPYAAAFHPARYEDAAYLAALEQWGETGAL